MTVPRTAAPAIRRVTLALNSGSHINPQTQTLAAQEPYARSRCHSHEVATSPDWSWRAGGVCTITIDHSSGVLAAGADPRRMGYAIGW